MFESMWRALKFSDDDKNKGAFDCETEDKKWFTPYRLRLMAVYIMLYFCMGVCDRVPIGYKSGIIGNF